jgi:FdrA protein
MAIVSIIKKNHYQDSMKLMQISQKLSALEGVKQASAIMATEANLLMLKEAGLIEDIPESAVANDLIIAVEAKSEKIGNEAILKLDSLITPLDIDATSSVKYKSLEEAAGALPGANVAVVSVPGEYAKLEVAKAITKGLHTFLFSDNLSVEEEIELKERAREKGLLVMGPGCGTAIINGIGLGFSNIIDSGPIGVIAGAGTGLQEVTSLINNLGSGITHGIGVGGRDLSEEVGGITTLEAIKMLSSDRNTKVLLLVSKPPSKTVAEKILISVRETGKPAVICFLGSDLQSEDSDIYFASTLEDASIHAVQLTEKNNKKRKINSGKNWKKHAQQAMKSLNSKQKYIRGLYSGGTLCYEAQHVLQPILGNIYSNAPLNNEFKLKDSNKSERNSLIDLGEEEFTVGRPHPMIDANLRSERIMSEAAKANVGVILFDVVLGYVASPDPAGDLLPAIKEAKKSAKKKGRNLVFVSHVCGTDNDPQGLIEQEEKLRQEGVLVFPTNALASRVAGMITARGDI